MCFIAYLKEYLSIKMLKKTKSLEAINYRKMKSLIYVGKKVALCQCSNLFFILYFSLFFFKEYQFNIMSQTYNNVRISNSLFSPVLQYTSRICSGFYYHFEKYFLLYLGWKLRFHDMISVNFFLYIFTRHLLWNLENCIAVKMTIHFW